MYQSTTNNVIKSSTGPENYRLWQMLQLIIFKHLKDYLREKKETKITEQMSNQ